MTTRSTLQGEIRAAKSALERAKSDLEVRNAFIRKTFGLFLSDEIVDTLLDSPDGLRLGGEKRRVTVLMSDLRDFTPMSEKLSPSRSWNSLTATLARWSR